jgi:UDP-glucuronate 4-epimerase
MAYLESNILGFGRVLEFCRRKKVGHLVFASSSSVYGLNEKVPFSVQDSVDHPVSLYAATKKSNELMAHSYSHLYGVPATGLRFFTVYGPWGRPDMAYFKFTKAILEGSPIEVYNHGEMWRDFTYVDDVVEGVCRILFRPAAPAPEWKAGLPDPSSSSAPYRIYNIGNSDPVKISEFLDTLEGCLGRKAQRIYREIQPGDVVSTAADVSGLEKDFGWKPSTRLVKGLEEFTRWYRGYYHV